MRRFPAALGALTALGLAVSSPPLDAREQPMSLGLAGGVHLPSDEDQERVYGDPATFALEWGSQLNDVDTWLDIGVGATRATGPEYASDATFEVDDATLWVVPISAGVRVNPVRSNGAPGDVRVYFGAGVTLAWVRLAPPATIEGLGDPDTGLARGFYLELRPEARVTGDWNVFGRARAEILNNVVLRNASELNPGGGRFQLGVSRWFR